MDFGKTTPEDMLEVLGKVHQDWIINDWELKRILHSLPYHKATEFTITDDVAGIVADLQRVDDKIRNLAEKISPYV